MGKVYYVIIKGRTLESRNLRELLSRAVSAKRSTDRRFPLQPRFNETSSAENPMRPCVAASTAVIV
jgi:hypothetical protein